MSLKEVYVSAAGMSPVDLKDELTRLTREGSDPPTFQTAPAPSGQYRGVDNSVVVAFINMMSGGVVPLVAGLLAIWKTKEAGVITVQSSRGDVVKIPTSVKPDDLGRYIHEINRLDVVHVHAGSSGG